MRLAHEIVVDHDAHQILLDGEVFPFYVQKDVEGAGPDEIASVTLRVYGSNVRVVREGVSQVMRQATPAEETAWARRRATDIVVEGLADVLKFIKRQPAATTA